MSRIGVGRRRVQRGVKHAEVGLEVFQRGCALEADHYPVRAINHQRMRISEFVLDIICDTQLEDVLCDYQLLNLSSVPMNRQATPS